MALTKLPKNAIGTGAVDASKIEDGTIQNAELAGSLTGTQLASTLDLSSKTITLPNTSVTSDQLVNSTIANNKLSNSTITVRGTSRALGDSFSLGVDVDWQSVIIADGSTSTTGSAGRGYFIDTTSAAHTFTLPASATRGDTIGIIDYAGTFATNKLTIARNGHNIQGVANNSLIGTNRASLILVYVDATKGWLFTEENNVADLQVNSYITATGGTVTESGDFKIHTFTNDGCFAVSQSGAGTGPSVVDYLVVAGGGGGNEKSGAGAGGYRESHSTPVSGCYSASPLATPTGITVIATTYPITVGGGGASTPPSGGQGPNTSGSPSVFSTITSAGGGKGAQQELIPGSTPPFSPSDFRIENGDGGSGGGTAGQDALGGQPGRAGNTPPVSPPQGQPGGNGPHSEPVYGAGAGGGAGGSGGNGSGSGGTNGGPGVTSSITGTPVTRAGGGGSGSFRGPTGSGGPGGGGPSPGTSGTANTGGGGGGGSVQPNNVPSQSGAGGKGIVIIRYKFQN